VRIVLCPDVFKALKIEKAGDRVEISVGEDDHLGRIRIQSKDTGIRLRRNTERSASLVAQFRKWERLMDAACGPISVPFKAVGADVIEVTLPYWEAAHGRKEAA
jgi:hypothetical protein